MMPSKYQKEGAIIALQEKLIKTNEQLIEAQEKLLHPLVKVQTATESEKLYVYTSTWKKWGKQANRYDKIVEAFYRLESAAFRDTVKLILGDDAKVEAQ